MATQPCPNCGKLNPAGAKFCAQCGQSLPVSPDVPAPESAAAEPPETPTAEIPARVPPLPDASPPTVRSAGAAVPPLPEPEPYVPAPETLRTAGAPPLRLPQEQPTGPYAAPRMCPNCGTANRPDAQRCGNCGYAFVATGPVVAPAPPAAAYTPPPRRQGSGWLLLPLLLLIVLLAVAAAAAIGFLASQVFGPTFMQWLAP